PVDDVAHDLVAGGLRRRHPGLHGLAGFLAAVAGRDPLEVDGRPCGFIFDDGLLEVVGTRLGDVDEDHRTVAAGTAGLADNRALFLPPAVADPDRDLAAAGWWWLTAEVHHQLSRLVAFALLQLDAFEVIVARGT